MPVFDALYLAALRGLPGNYWVIMRSAGRSERKDGERWVAKSEADAEEGRGRGRGNRGKAKADPEEDGGDEPHAQIDRDAARRMIVHYAGLGRVAAAQDGEAQDNGAGGGNPLSGSALLTMLKAGGPKVTRYTKGELLSIRQLPASKIRPPTLDNYVDKENLASPLLIRNQGAEDAEDGGEGDARQRTSRRKDRHGGARGRGDTGTSHDLGEEDEGEPSAQRSGDSSKAGAVGGGGRQDAMLNEMLFPPGSGASGAQAAQASRGLGKWFGDAGKAAPAGASAKPASPTGISLSKATMSGPPGTHVPPKGGPAAGMPGGMPPGFPYNAAYMQAYAQAMMAQAAMDPRMAQAQGFGRGVVPPGHPPGWPMAMPGPFPFPGYPGGPAGMAQHVGAQAGSAAAMAHLAAVARGGGGHPAASGQGAVPKSKKQKQPKAKGQAAAAPQMVNPAAVAKGPPPGRHAPKADHHGLPQTGDEDGEDPGCAQQ